VVEGKKTNGEGLMHDRRGGLGFAVIVALLVIVALGGCVSGPSGQAGDGQVSATKRSELRVGVSADYPPVIFERDGEYAGIEADLARRLGGGGSPLWSWSSRT
jgi:ABC-type amino acid transport substrate-binding protein